MKSKFFYLVLILGIIFISSCGGSSKKDKSLCKLPGCNKKAIGWDHDPTGCARWSETGGYCSRDHCADDSSK